MLIAIFELLFGGIMLKVTMWIAFLTTILLGCQDGFQNYTEIENGTPNSIMDSENISEVDLDTTEIQILEKFGTLRQKEISLKEGYKGYDYNLSIPEEVGYPAFRYFVYEDSLPDGLELNEVTGQITGIPEKNGEYHFAIAIQKTENSDDLKIIPMTTVIGNLIMSKEIHSFIDLSINVRKKASSYSDTDKVYTVTHNNLISLPDGYDFKFYGNTMNRVRVCQEGYLKLGTSSSLPSNCADSDLNFASNRQNLLVPFGDLELIAGTDSEILYQTRGKSPDRMTIIHFKNFHRSTDSLASQNFEVVIHETSYAFQFLYGLSYSITDSNLKHLGSNAKVAITNTSSSQDIVTAIPQIFNGTGLLFTANGSNLAGNYTYKTAGNVVTDFVDIARISDEFPSCSSNSGCLTERCVAGRCLGKNVSNSLFYNNGVQVALPFTFNFYGQSFSNIKIHENGYLYFSSNYSNFINGVPSVSTPFNIADMKLDNNTSLDYVIAPFYSNIDLKSVKGGNVLYNVVGESPNRKFIVMYDNVRVLTPDYDKNNDGILDHRDYRLSDTHLCTFQVVLHETSNVVEFLYGTPALESSQRDICQGAAATIGIRKDSSTYTNISNNLKLLTQGQSVVFVPNNATASSYTWVGLGNDNPNVQNSPSTGTSAGTFVYRSGGWNTINDIPTQFNGYTQTVVSDQWIDASGGTNLNLMDDSYAQVNTNFPVKFYGLDYQTLYVQSNGAITFTNAVIAYNEPSAFNYAPQVNWPDKGIFAMWNDLNPSHHGSVRVGTTTKNGHSVFIAQWHDIPQYYNAGNNRFQIQMYDDGRIYYCYKDFYANSHLTGLRNSQTDFVPYTGSIPSLVSSNQCVEYTPNYIPGNGTRLAVSGQDGAVQTISIPFTLSLGAQTFNQITVSSNGGVVLGSVNDLTYNNQHLSHPSAPDNFIAVFWDDLDSFTRNSGNAGIFTGFIGTAPNRKFIVSYNDVAHYPSSSDTSHINAQMVINESGFLELCYGNLSGTYASGADATIGVKINSTRYDQLSYNTAGRIVPNSCYTWIPNATATTSARNIHTGKMNSSFLELPVRNPDFTGEIIKETYGSQNLTYLIYDLDPESYTFEFKGKKYDKIFIAGNGAVSFGNQQTAFLVSGPMWQDVYFTNDIQSQSHASLLSPYENQENNFMWVANSGDGTMTRINTYTGESYGPYQVGGSSGSSPSRTSVGFDGSVWVGNRGTHNITKLDRNGAHVCTVNLHAGCAPRAVALDKDENAWVGCMRWSSSEPEGWIYKIRHNRQTDSCEIIDMRAPGDPYQTSGDTRYWAFKGHAPYGTYGFAIDRNGILWSSPGTWGSGNSAIARVDTNKQPNQAGFYKKFKGASASTNHLGNGRYNSPANNMGTAGIPHIFYGISIDFNGDIWLGNWSNQSASVGITKAHYNETTDTLEYQIFPSFNNQHVSHGRGTAVDAEGYVWIAYSGTHNVGKYGTDGTPIDLYGTNGNTSPTGVGVDGDGDIWVNHLNGYSVELQSDGTYIRRIYSGPSPYCYSDNTGFNLRNVTAGATPTEFYAAIINDPADALGNKARKLVVQWRNVRLKRIDGGAGYTGYTEANVEMTFDNGSYFDANNVLQSGTKPVEITYSYGSIRGNNTDLKTGGRGHAVLRSLFGDYTQTFGSEDAGTINSGSMFKIVGKPTNP